MADLSPAAFVVVIAIAAGCSLLVYRHAETHGSRHPTAWGIATFLFTTVVVPVYVLSYLVRRRR